MNNKLIDISGTIEEFSLSSDEVSSLSRYILDSVSGEFKRNWESNVDNSGLHQTKQSYYNAMYFQQPDDYNIIIGLATTKDKLALMLEDGATSFDIKKGFARSNKRVQKLSVDKKGNLIRDSKGRTQDGGWYMTIPFRWATSEAIAESSIFASKMPKQIEKIVKISSKPLSVGQLPKGFEVIKTNSVGYTHQSSIYTGIERKDISERNKGGGYWSFRRVSDTSDPNSWIHPGFPPLKLMEKTLNELQIDAIVDRAVDEFLSKKFN